MITAEQLKSKKQALKKLNPRLYNKLQRDYIW